LKESDCIIGSHYVEQPRRSQFIHIIYGTIHALPELIELDLPFTAIGAVWDFAAFHSSTAIKAESWATFHFEQPGRIGGYVYYGDKHLDVAEAKDQVIEGFAITPYQGRDHSVWICGNRGAFDPRDRADVDVAAGLWTYVRDDRAPGNFKDTLTQVSAKSELAVATRYAMSRWKALTRFVADGDATICRF
jgi:hypothetical protein